MLQLYDTATGRVRELAVRELGKVSLYVCGPTVYDLPHIGHGRSLLVYDVLRRYLEWRGLEVRHVSNVTDIDDKIIERAAREGRPAEEVARRFERAWFDAADALGALRPHETPRATEYVEAMVQLVADLVGGGSAYETSDGVYFAVDALDGYGLLAGQSLDSLRAGERVEVADEKRSPHDFALWKKAKPGEPSWPSPWGAGRPGWHTECVVMSLRLLGEGFDLHAGGLDLRFPHHENERAQAVAMGRSFARHWMHHAFVETAGEKMSKSLGNFTSLPDMLAHTDARAYRLLVVQSHYRSPLEVTPESVQRAERTLGRLDELARKWSALGPDRPVAPPDPEALARFGRAMDDDLATPAATALLFELVGAANVALDAGDLVGAAPIVAAVEQLAGALGLQASTGAAELDDEATRLVEARDAARAARDYATADALRDRLSALGWVVKDGPSGTMIHR